MDKRLASCSNSTRQPSMLRLEQIGGQHLEVKVCIRITGCGEARAKHVDPDGTWHVVKHGCDRSLEHINSDGGQHPAPHCCDRFGCGHPTCNTPSVSS